MTEPQGVKRCECTDLTGPDGCQAKATWLVGIGSRVSDRQLSCGRHLHRTCQAMLGAELPHQAVVTVSWVTEFTSRYRTPEEML